MHSYLIHGNNSENKDKHIEKIVKSLKAKTLEFSLEKISDARELASIAHLSVKNQTAIIIKNTENASSEALNAFLKNLEEPQKNITFIIVSTSIHNLPPTIISRCQIINAGNNYTLINSKFDEIDRFLNLDVSKKLLFINNIRKKDEALNFAKNLNLVIHQKLLAGEGHFLKLVKNAQAAQSLYRHLSANGNVSLTLTSLILDLAENKAKLYN